MKFPESLLFCIIILHYNTFLMWTLRLCYKCPSYRDVYFKEFVKFWSQNSFGKGNWKVYLQVRSKNLWKEGLNRGRLIYNFMRGVLGSRIYYSAAREIWRHIPRNILNFGPSEITSGAVLVNRI